MSSNQNWTPRGTQVPVSEIDSLVVVYKTGKSYRIYPKPEAVVYKRNGPNAQRQFTYLRNGVFVKVGTPTEIQNKNTPFDPNRQQQGNYQRRGGGGGYGGRGYGRGGGGYGNRGYGNQRGDW